MIGRRTIALPEEPMRYTSIPNALSGEGIWGCAGINAANVAMSATETLTSNPRVLRTDPLVEQVPAADEPGSSEHRPEQPGGFGEEDFVTLVLPYIRSAREGVERLGALLTEHGTYEMNGIAFSDESDIWWLETVGGHHWIARRVRKDHYVTMPNQLGIDSFGLDDVERPGLDHLASPDLRDSLREHHLDLTLRETADESASGFNPREAFGSRSESDHVYNTPRAWYMQRTLNPSSEVWDGGHPARARTPMASPGAVGPSVCSPSRTSRTCSAPTTRARCSTRTRPAAPTPSAASSDPSASTATTRSRSCRSGRACRSP